MSVAVFDVDGTIIPGAELDELYELGFDDADFGPAESWPAWTDMGIWETGPETDVTAEPYVPTLEDELDYAEWASEVERRWQDERIEAGPITDADLAAAGLAVG